VAPESQSKLKAPHSIIETLFEGLRASLKTRSSISPFADGAPVLIYGAGNVGKDVFGILTQQGVSVIGFLDQQAKSGSAWHGVPIMTADDPALSAAQRQQAHVVIGIFNAYVEIPPILTLLKTLGYGRVTSFLELHDRFAAELGDRFWLTSRSYYCGLEQQVSAGYELWADDVSRELNASILRFRFSKDHKTLGAPDWDGQYFPKDLPFWPVPLRFVDCGAFDGDTLRQLMTKQIPLEAIAAFEPDPANFMKLAHYMRTSSSELPDTVCLFPCGVDSATMQVRFSSGQGTGSHASATGDTVIQCVSLDQALPSFRPNLIKMDIEGAEFAALLGGRHLIAEHRPGLAICLYHRPEHLWQIPLLVQQLTGGSGKYFLRSHSINGFDLVLYWGSVAQFVGKKDRENGMS
jgi:FkbM family methyltransferase